MAHGNTNIYVLQCEWSGTVLNGIIGALVKRPHKNMPMNCRARSRKVTISTELEKEISRIDDLWSGFREKYSNCGPWLFGEFSIANCMFTPVVFRFTTYDVSVSELSKDYMNNILGHPETQLWLAQSKDGIETIDFAEVGK